MEYYTTVAGDVWDIIAKKFYGNELMADRIMQDRENITLLDYAVFPFGIVLHIPEVTEEQSYQDNLPDWRRS